jgi:hypothetical protein
MTPGSVRTILRVPVRDVPVDIRDAVERALGRDLIAVRTRDGMIAIGYVRSIGDGMVEVLVETITPSPGPTKMPKLVIDAGPGTEHDTEQSPPSLLETVGLMRGSG